MAFGIIPLSLYIHFPWCVRKCPYCDFNSHTLPNQIPEDLYIACLIEDLENALPDIWNRRIISIFMGGGTPSLFSPSAIAKLLEAINSRLPLIHDIEITMEANPGTIDEKNFSGYRAAGINRLSIGVQSFNEQHLKILGRIHDSDAAKRAIQVARKADFKNINLDLMFGLPQQTLSEAQQDLMTAIALEPEHLSWYQLTIEPNTVFYKQRPTLPADEKIIDIQEAGLQLLQQTAFQQYEVSAYSQQHKQCQHNRNYWEFGDYLGIGAGAHSKITHTHQERINRSAKVRQPKDYIDPNKKFIAETHDIPKEEVAFEFMLNALRLYENIRIDLFKERTGLKPEALFPTLKQAEAKKLLQWDNEKICLTPLGRQFLNDVVEMFL